MRSLCVILTVSLSLLSTSMVYLIYFTLGRRSAVDSRDVKCCTVYGVIGTQHILNKYHMPSVSHLPFTSKIIMKYILHLLALVQKMLLQPSKTPNYPSPFLHQRFITANACFEAVSRAVQLQTNRLQFPSVESRMSPDFIFETTSFARRSTR